jgi:hypothetical protein
LLTGNTYLNAVENIPFLWIRIQNSELPDPERPIKYGSGGSGTGTLLTIKFVGVFCSITF